MAHGRSTGTRPGNARGGRSGRSGRRPRSGAPEPVQHRRAHVDLGAGDDLQQLLRARPRQGRPVAPGRHAQGPPLDRRDRGRGEPAAERGHRCAVAVVSARRARLSDALRRGLVHGHPVGRFPARRPSAPRRTDLRGALRRVHFAPRSRAAARTKGRRARLALRRGPAPGRGDEPARDPRRRPLRPPAPRPERRAAAPRRSVEVRVQGSEVDREDHADARPAPHDVEHGRPRGVRLLRQRQSGRGPSPLEPGDRAPHRRGEAPADAALQRLRGTGRRALHRHGPAQELRRRPP